MMIAAAVEICEHLCHSQLYVKTNLVRWRKITEKNTFLDLAHRCGMLALCDRQKQACFLWSHFHRCFTSTKQEGSGASESSYLGGLEATRWDRQRLQTALTASLVAPQLPRGLHRKYVVPEGVIKSWYQVLSESSERQCSKEWRLCSC